MKVSYNRGADLMTCLAAVKTGSTDCEQGLVAEVNNFTDLGVSKDAVFPFDGAGSNDQNRVIASGSRHLLQERDRHAVRAGALRLATRSSARTARWPTSSPTPRRRARRSIKTGNRVVGTAAEQIIVLGNSLAGYVEAKSGRQFTVMVAMDNIPFAVARRVRRRSPRTRPRWWS